MQKSPKVAVLAVMVKATHHQRGAGCSTTPEMRSVSQLKLRLFKTSGTRASGSASLISGAVGAASIILIGGHPEQRRRRRISQRAINHIKKSRVRPTPRARYFVPVGRRYQSTFAHSGNFSSK